MPELPDNPQQSRPRAHVSTPLVLVAQKPRAPVSEGTPLRHARLIVAAIAAALFAGSFVCMAGFWFLFEMYRTLPTFEQLHDIEPPQVSQVYAVDGSLVHEFSTERRIWVPIDSVPQALLDAIIATEDRRFYRHWGIDMYRIVGAVVVDLTRGHYAQGASTITQQLARNLYLTSRQSMVRKIREALTAIQLESYYTKREILESYVNQVYLGAGAYGVQAASQTYFSKSVHQLDLNECAVLAGLVQLPERYRPDKPDNHPRTIGRRRSVLRAMSAYGTLDHRLRDSLMDAPVPNNPLVRPPAVAPYFIDMVRSQLATAYGDDALYNGGLKIYTTLDPVAQDSTERALTLQLDTLQRRCNSIFLDSTKADRALRMPRDTFLAHFDSLYDLRRTEFDTLADSVRLRIAQAAVIALDVPTGAIRVLIGGRNFAESKFNRALNARRQPGSAIKPLVYTVAMMDSGFTPATVVLDQPITLMTDKGEWRPENYDKEFLGPITIRAALAKSINLVAIQVLMQVGAQRVVDLARLMGLKQEMQPVPALAIGACQATPMEMVAAYNVYAHAGTYVAPYCIDKVIDRNGRTLQQHTIEYKEVLTKQVAFIMCDMMKDVVRRGTAAKIGGLGFYRPAGGKTGTTNDYSDAWFIGFTPQVTCAVWTGIDERRSMGRGVTGADAAVPVWVPAMRTLHRGMPIAEFSVPDSIVRERICTESHTLATMYCPAIREEYFLLNTMSDSCTVHGTGAVRREGNIDHLFGTGTRKTEPRKDSTAVRRPLMF